MLRFCIFSFIPLKDTKEVVYTRFTSRRRQSLTTHPAQPGGVLYYLFFVLIFLTIEFFRVLVSCTGCIISDYTLCYQLQYLCCCFLKYTGIIFFYLNMSKLFLNFLYCFKKSSNQWHTIDISQCLVRTLLI